MKSMLHEASSVSKAVEKAWIDAGKPNEFAIKILEAGEKNFLGLSKSPAIVSITYEPRKQVVKNVPVQRTILGAKDQGGSKKVVIQEKKIVAQEKRDSEPQSELLVWQDEMVAFVAKELKELLSIWGTVSEFSSKIDKKTLMITINGRLHDDAIEERNVFMSFSYLLIQLLKRHYKKKFRGFQLIITAKKVF